MSSFQGFIPAAGLGTRLRPLSLRTPKPLMPIGCDTPLQLAFNRMGDAGCTSIAINSHHLPDQIRMAARSLGSKIAVFPTVSYEPQLLGTGGFFGPLRSWLTGQDVVIYNSDIVSDIDLLSLVQTHQKARAFATMALLPTPASKKTKIYLCENGDIAGIGTVQKKQVDEKALLLGSFTGVHVLSDEFIRHLPKEGPCDVIAVYKRAIEAGRRIASSFHKGLWYDIGDPLSLWEAYSDILFDRSKGEECRTRLGIKLDSTVPFVLTLSDEQSDVKGALIGPSCWVSDQEMLKRGAKLSHSIVLHGSLINRDETIDRQLLGYGERLRIE